MSRIISRVVIATAASLPLVGCWDKNKKVEQVQKEEQVSPLVHPQQDSEKKDIFEELLQTKGAKGFMHGSVPGTDTFVFTYGEVLKSEHFSLIPANDAIRAKLHETARHQAVTIHGKILSKATPQRHVLVEEIQVGDKWDPKFTFQYKEQPRITDLTKHLKEKKEILCTVHALLHGGKVLVVNYQGHIVPVYVEDPKWTKDLWTTDKIRLRFEVRDHQGGPPHVSLRDEKDIVPVEVIESIVALKEKERQVEGSLVWFPKTPVTTFEVWGIQEKDSNGLSRIYALFNSEDKKELQKIDALLRNAWNGEKEGFVRRSTSFYNTNVQLRVHGVVTQFSPNQGNPVIELRSQDIEFKNKGGNLK